MAARCASILARRLQIIATPLRNGYPPKSATYSHQVYTRVALRSTIPQCTFSTTAQCHQIGEAEEAEDEGEEQLPGDEQRLQVDVDTSIRYMESKAYQITYGGSFVWEPYRRNHKGQIAPKKTRKTCIRAGVISTGNPCPICRDEYLVVHPKNTKLLQQFISPQSGQLLSYGRTGVCQKQHKNLQVALKQAWDQGMIEMPVPFREYDYSLYYPQDKERL